MRIHGDVYFFHDLLFLPDTTIESAMVENVGVAVGVSLLSYPVTEIQSTSGILTVKINESRRRKTEIYYKK